MPMISQFISNSSCESGLDFVGGPFYDKVERKTVYKRAACKFVKIYLYVASPFLNISHNHLPSSWTTDTLWTPLHFL